MNSAIATDAVKSKWSINKRLLLITVVALTVGLSFWMGSRVPNLNEKAMMGGDAQIEALGFDQVYAIHETDSFVAKVLKTTVNWMVSRRRFAIRSPSSTASKRSVRSATEGIIFPPSTTN